MLPGDNLREQDQEVSISRDTARTPAATYRELFRIGSGGFATISVALAQGIEGFTKLVVLKTLREELSVQPDASKMFLDEARLLARMNHPNVVQVYEVFRQGNSAAIAMEYVDGQTFSTILTRCRESGTPLSLDFGVYVLTKVLAALGYAHTLRDFSGEPLGLIHRDVSPQNVMVTYDGQVKLLDFGIAKLASSQFWSADQTCTGVVKGKLTYMAPEQFLGQVDPRSDIFAVGVMLWELAARRRYWAQSPEAVIMRRLGSGELPHLSDAIEIDPDLAEICEKALAHDVEKRYAHAAAMQEDLERYLGGRGSAVSPAAIGQFVSDKCAEERSRVEEAIRSRLSEIGPVLTGKHDAPFGDTTLPGDAPQFGLSRSKKIALASAAVAAVAMLVGYVAYSVRGAAQPGLSAALLAQPGSSSASGALVRLRAHAQPNGAVWFLDDTKLGPDPVDTRLPRDDGAHMLRAEADGHEPFLRAIRIEADMDVVAVLAQKPADPAQPSAGALAAPRKGASATRSLVSRLVNPPAEMNAVPLESTQATPIAATTTKKDNPPPATWVTIPGAKKDSPSSMPLSSTPKKDSPPAAPVAATPKKDSLPAPPPTATAKRDSVSVQFGDSLRRASRPEQERRVIETEYPGGG